LISANKKYRKQLFAGSNPAPLPKIYEGGGQIGKADCQKNSTCCILESHFGGIQ